MRESSMIVGGIQPSMEANLIQKIGLLGQKKNGVKQYQATNHYATQPKATLNNKALSSMRSNYSAIHAFAQD